MQAEIWEIWTSTYEKNKKERERGTRQNQEGLGRFRALPLNNHWIFTRTEQEKNLKLILCREYGIKLQLGVLDKVLEHQSDRY